MTKPELDYLIRRTFREWGKTSLDGSLMPYFFAGRQVDNGVEKDVVIVGDDGVTGDEIVAICEKFLYDTYKSLGVEIPSGWPPQGQAAKRAARLVEECRRAAEAGEKGD